MKTEYVQIDKLNRLAVVEGMNGGLTEIYQDEDGFYYKRRRSLQSWGVQDTFRPVGEDEAKDFIACSW